jgi:hypothetical protein
VAAPSPLLPALLWLVVSAGDPSLALPVGTLGSPRPSSALLSPCGLNPGGGPPSRTRSSFARAACRSASPLACAAGVVLCCSLVVGRNSGPSSAKTAKASRGQLVVIATVQAMNPGCSILAAGGALGVSVSAA